MLHCTTPSGPLWRWWFQRLHRCWWRDPPCVLRWIEFKKCNVLISKTTPSTTPLIQITKLLAGNPQTKNEPCFCSHRRWAPPLEICSVPGCTALSSHWLQFLSDYLLSYGKCYYLENWYPLWFERLLLPKTVRVVHAAGTMCGVHRYVFPSQVLSTFELHSFVFINQAHNIAIW